MKIKKLMIWFQYLYYFALLAKAGTRIMQAPTAICRGLPELRWTSAIFLSDDCGGDYE